MAEKVASVKVTLNNRSVLGSVAQMEGRFEKAGRNMGGSLGRAIDTAIGRIGRAVATIPRLMASAIGALPNGVITGLRKIEAAGLSTARKIGAAFKSAFSGANMSSAGDAWTRFKKLAGKGAGGAVSGLGDAGSVMVGNLGAGLVQGTISKGMDLLSEANTVADKALGLSIQARGAGQAYIDPKLLMAEFFAVANDIKGATAEDAADAAAQYVTMTGDIAAARNNLKSFATVAVATKTQMSSVAATAASLAEKFGIVDPKEMQDVLAALIMQGKSGAFELKDAADKFTPLSAAGAAFGLEKGAASVKILGGLSQIAMKGTGQRDQAATSLLSVFSQITAKAESMAKRQNVAERVNIYKSKKEGGGMRDIQSILIDIIAKTGGSNEGKKKAGLGELFGEQGIKAINPLIKAYMDATKATVGTEAQKTAAGVAALKEELNKAINAPGAWADVVSDAAMAQTSSTAKITAATERFKGALAEHVLPRLADFIDRLAESPEKINAVITTIEAFGTGLEHLIKLLQDLGLVESKKPPAASTAVAGAPGAEGAAAQPTPAPEESLFDKAIKGAKIGAADAFVPLYGLNKLKERTSELGMPGKIATDTLTGGTLAGARSLYGAMTGGQKPSGPQRLAGIDGEVKVRVVNPTEVGGNTGQTGAGSPTPSFMYSLMPR